MPNPKEQSQAQEQEEGSGKKSKLKLIILVVLIVALGGGGFFGYKKFFGKKSEGVVAEEQKPTIPQAVTYQLDTFLVNLADPGGKRYLKLTMELELDNPKVIDE
ncbi:MAG: flagellar basal body protein FliL, partial [Deltaproteobacteria bacterium]|nr:flagellar basal body protein FliL [Deltaproteobacteria bacterium]